MPLASPCENEMEQLAVAATQLLAIFAMTIM